MDGGDEPAAAERPREERRYFNRELSWLSFLCFPIMAVVQEVSGRIGRTTGQGLAANIRQHYSPWLLLGCVQPPEAPPPSSRQP